MKYKYLYILLPFFLLSCDDGNVDNNQIDTLHIKQNNGQNHSQIYDTLSNYIILDKIKEIDPTSLPFPVKKYFENPNSVKLELIDYYSANFQLQSDNEYFWAKVQYLKPYYGKEIISFFVFKKDTLGFTNYFFFLQNINGKWSNVSEIFITDEIITLLKTELNTNIEYKTISSISAYFSGKTNKALRFYFSNVSKILILIDNNWISVGQIIFKNNSFILISTTSNTGQAKFLSADELDLTKRYTNVNQALADSTNVYILDLASIGINALDNRICNLKRLQILILDDNYLTKFPTEICNLEKLQIIRINSNQITELPTDFGIMSNIEELSVSHNKISFLPLSLSNAKSLRILNLDHNLLTTIVIDFSNLQELIILNLSHNNLKILPTSIGYLENLISLDISNNPIKNLPNQIYQLKNLNYVDVSNTNIPDSQIVKLMDINPEMTIIMD